MEDYKETQHTDIAIIGIGLKIADASTVSEYWNIFENNIDCIRDIPEHRKKQVREYAKVFIGEDREPEYYKGSYLENLDEFDYKYFKISPREAQVMEPAQRLILETICETFDDAGYSAKALKGSKTGVFIGYSSASFKDNYLMDISFMHPDLLKYSMVGNMPAILPARASHTLDLKGPSMVLDTACSSSLVAIIQACDSIKSHTSSMAIAGGVKLNLLPLITQDTKLGFESNDNKTRAFDAGASGTSIGEGTGCILLKSLEQAEKDHDHIYAVIKGMSINHDGTAMGITAPNPVAQKNVIIDALEDSNIHPDEIDYIETHGTATVLGDPIEFQGLNNAFGTYTKRKQFCALSAAKSNLGHLYECAGMAAIIKAIAAIQYKKIPGMKNFLQPNMIIGFCNSPFYINQSTKDWNVTDGKLRTCGVSAFGISGTNCHLILQEHMSKVEKENERPVDILCLSAKCHNSLQALVERYKKYLTAEDIDMNKVAVNTNMNKMHFQLRLAITFENKKDLINKLNEIQDVNELEAGIKLKDIYYSNLDKLTLTDHAVIPNNEILQDCNDMLLAYDYDKEDCNNQAKSDIMKMMKGIAMTYIKGTDIKWEILYKEFCQDKIVLPHYPFEKSHLWLPIEELAVKEQKRENENNTLEISTNQNKQIYYQRIFLEKSSNYVASNLGDCLLVQLSNNHQNSLNKCLESKFNKLVTIDIDENMMKIINTETYFMQLYKNVDFSTITHVVYSGFVFKDSIQNDKELRYFQKVSLLGLSSLYRCLNASVWKKNNFTIVSLMNCAFGVTGEESYVRPECAAIFGFGKALHREFKNMHSLCIDFDEDTNIGNVVEEICSGNTLDIVCYRKNQRYIEGLKEVNIPTVEKEVTVKDGGVYLITGGASGIGFETAMELVRRAENITLILLNRASLPEESQWEEIIRGNQDHKVVKRIKNIQELQKYAKCVEYFSCDIANQDSVCSIIDSVNKMYGKISGVFHAAGIGGGTNLAGLNEERVMGMIAPKIFGTFILDHAMRNQGLDFFVMFSSISTIFSSSDLADYAAGNVFLDAYCEYRRKTQPGISLTVNWATWSETGMSVEHNFTIDTLFKSIKTKPAILALFSAINRGSGNIIIGELNLESKFGLLIKKYPMELSPYIQEKVKLLEKIQKKEQEEAVLQSKSQTGEYGLVERQLCDVCCKVLGYKDINIFDNFFELGSDSIMLGYIFNEVDQIYPGLLKITDLFTRPTVKSLSEYILELGGGATEEEKENVPDSADVVNEDELNTSDYNDEKIVNDNDIAIIGVGMNIPNSGNLDEYWDILINGINVVREMPDEHKTEVENHIKYLHKSFESVKFRKCGYLDEINKFDYTYFGISPRESSLIDPANRLFLQCCATAIDDSGYGKDGIKGTNTGVFLGYSANIGSAYSRLLYEADPELFSASLPLNQVSMSASKPAYLFDLKGPSMVIDTACSSSLVSIHVACEQIRNGNCDMALAGGVSLALAPVADKFSVGFESQEEKTRAFADKSTGTAVGEGVGVVLLKSLKQAIMDGDAIYSVIKGSAINQDGSSFGIAAPNYLAQSEAIQKAWKSAGVSPYDISYIEAHGTGTPLGDPIEVRGITHAFETVTNDRQVCGIGSLKTNIGHLNEASGVSGILKMILMLKFKMIPPSLNMTIPNRNIDFLSSPLYVVTKPTPLKPKNSSVIIGINGFGMSGTNCHLIMEEAPRVSHTRTIGSNEPYVFTITAKSTNALKNLLIRYKDFVNNQNKFDFGNLCYNINVGRYHNQYRVAFKFRNREDLIEKLETLSCNYPYDVSITECYIGQYAIVPENKTNRYFYEITLNEQRDLTAKAKKIISDYNESGLQKLLNDLLELYINGADIEWKDLFNGTYKKMHIPTYPYDKHHCWYKLPEIEFAAEDETINLDSYYYEKKWVCNDDEDRSKLNPGDTVVILYDQEVSLNGLSSMLVEEGIDVVNVYCSDDYRKENNNIYYVSSNTESYQTLFEDIIDRNIKMIIHSKSICTSSSENSNEITNKLECGFFDLISIIKGVSRAHISNKIDLIIVSNNAYCISGDEKYLVPENATILSLGKVIEQEYTNISCRAIDMDLETSVHSIMQEIYVDTNLYMAGYRNNVRYGQELDEADIDKSNEHIFNDGGVYIVTGGTDGIGLETAKYISQQVEGHLILLSRKGFVEEKEWEALRNDEQMRHKIEVFESIKTNGSTLDIYSCDVGDYSSVKKVLEKVRDKFGRINGIVHSAGISGAGYILRKEKESFLSIFNPKIYGAWNLDTLTINDKLDFMILYSSAVTDSGEAGQSDYVAANSYLDAFTDYRNRKGQKTLTVNWVSWKETGMSVIHGINVDSATKAITTKEGIIALDRFIKSSKQRVTIGQFNVDANFLALSQYSRNLASLRLGSKIEALRKISQSSEDLQLLSDGNRNFAQIKNGKLIFIPKSEKTSKSKIKNKDIRLVGDYTNQYSNTEKVIGSIYSSILGYEEINVFDNFFEMGGDSVMLSEMHDLIDEKYTDYITIADLFEFTYVRTLSEYIDSKQPVLECVSAAEEVAGVAEELVEKEDALSEPKIEIYEASEAQKRIYYDCRINANKLVYNNPFLSDITEFEGDLEEVINQIIDRHDILRTSFKIIDIKLMQCVLPSMKISINYIHVPDINKIDYHMYLKTVDFKKAPLFNATVFLGPKNEKILLFDVHHILLDGYSSSLFQDEMLKLALGNSLEEPKCQYSDYVKFEAEFKITNEYKEMEQYWTKRLENYDDSNALLTKNKNNKVSYDSLEDRIDNELEGKLKKLSKNINISLFSVFNAALTLAVAHESARNDIVLLVPGLNRYRPRFKRILGMFTNLIPMRNCFVDDTPISEYLIQVGKHVEQDISNQFCDYNRIVELAKNTIDSRTPNFYYSFDFEDQSIKKIKDKKELSMNQMISKNSIDFATKKYNNNFQIEITYKVNLYFREQIENILSNFNKILVYFVEDNNMDKSIKQLKSSLTSPTKIS